MSMKALRKAMKDKKTDTFDEGTVIRWISGGRYTYAAIKTPVGWYSTASFDNGFVPKRMTFEELLEVLTHSGMDFVEVATDWELV